MLVFKLRKWDWHIICSIYMQSIDRNRQDQLIYAERDGNKNERILFQDAHQGTLWHWNQ